MRLDLRRDFADIYAHLADRVKKFKPGGKNVLGGRGPVKMIYVGFEYAQAGWLVVVFDTRPDAEPDGEWNSRIEGNELERPHWLEAGESEEPLTLVQLDGSKIEVGEDEEPAEFLGELIKAVVLKARAEGLFAALPKAAGCELGIEHFSGAYGWPDYEDRGKENLAEPGAAPKRRRKK